MTVASRALFFDLLRRHRRRSFAGGSTVVPATVSVTRTLPDVVHRMTALLVEVPGLLFRGVIGQVGINRAGKATLEVRSLLSLGRAQSSEVYGPSCRAALYDFRCKVDKTAFAANTTIASVIDAFTITVSSSPDGRASDPGWYALGAAVITSGSSTGATFDLLSWTPGTLTLTTLDPIDQLLSGGESITLYAGCDKQATTCRDKFSNIVNFRGESYAPGRDLALSQN